MGRIIRFWPRGRRLKGLDEFQTPAFLGRMDRVMRGRRRAWHAILGGAIIVGAAIGWRLF